MATEVILKVRVDSFGPYDVIEGRIEFDSVTDDVRTTYWVERDGEPVSRFGDVHYASVRARMLWRAIEADAPAPPDMNTTGGVEIVQDHGRFQVAAGTFGVEKLFWLIDLEQMRALSEPGTLRATMDFLAKMPTRSKT
jgi:hypothetical protein